MQQLFLLLSSVVIGVADSRAACSYVESRPLTSLAEVREAVPIGTPFQKAQDRMAVAGFVCLRQMDWSLQGGSRIGIRFGSTKYIECTNFDRTELGFRRTIQVKLVIADDKVADVQYSVTYNWPYNSKPAITPAAFNPEAAPWAPAFIPPVGPPIGLLPLSQRGGASK